MLGLPALTISFNYPAIEMARFYLYARLRKILNSKIKEEGVESRRGWIRVFERWTLYSKSIEGPQSSDPLFPSVYPNKIDYSTLVAELAYLEGMDIMKAQRVADVLISNSLYFSSKLSEQTLRTKSKGAVSLATHPAPRNKIDVEFIGETAFLKLLPQQVIKTKTNLRRPFKININCLKKLSQLWSPTMLSSAPIDDIPGEWKQLKKSKTAFLSDVFVLLARYNSLEGHGYQAGISESVFSYLEKSFGVTTELFASPLNCNLKRYCSLFPDIDSGNYCTSEYIE